MPSDRPTLDTVAEAAGVSRMTVSNAYNRPDQLSASTRVHVLQVADRLGYAGPDPAGRSLRRRRVDTIGVLLTERLPTAFTDPGLVSLMRGLSTELGAAGQAALLVPAEADRDGSLVRNALVDGFVVCSMGPTDPAVTSVVARRLPDGDGRQLRACAGVPFVGTDNTAPARWPRTAPAELGHRRLGDRRAARPGGDQPGRRRGPGPVGAAATGWPGSPRPWSRPGSARPTSSSRTRPPTPWPPVGAAARELLDLPTGRRPTAVFGVTDVLALRRDGGRRRCRPAGAAGPVGRRLRRHPRGGRADPGLTTVSQSLFAQGQAAARLVLRLVAGERPVRPGSRGHAGRPAAPPRPAAPRRASAGRSAHAGGEDHDADGQPGRTSSAEPSPTCSASSPMRGGPSRKPPYPIVATVAMPSAPRPGAPARAHRGREDHATPTPHSSAAGEGSARPGARRREHPETGDRAAEPYGADPAEAVDRRVPANRLAAIATANAA